MKSTVFKMGKRERERGEKKSKRKRGGRRRRNKMPVLETGRGRVGKKPGTLVV